MGQLNPDPSMEEILASIKRVIAEDSPGGMPRAARGSRPMEAPPLAEQDVLELDDPIFDEAEAEETAAEAAEEEPALDTLISSDTAAASRQSLAALAEARERAGETGDGPLEAVVREMLKPMLKDWLDQNLPAIVEDIVSREIARINGKG